MERSPAVSGLFYPRSPEEVKSMLERFFGMVKPASVPGRIIGIVVPHAGWIYSGLTATHSYAAIREQDRRSFIIIGPNHQGYPSYAAVYPDGFWKTPLGSARINERLSNVVAGGGNVRRDTSAHSGEHSIEVQVPFLQHMYGEKFDFVPVVLGRQDMEIARMLSDTLNPMIPESVVVVSSDLTHYESHETVVEKDKIAMNAIESLDVNEFYDVIRKEHVTACGYGAIAVLMNMTRKLGGKIITLHHSTSGEASGDYDAVVGYPSMLAYV